MIHSEYKTCDLCGKEYKLKDIGGSFEISSKSKMIYSPDVCDNCFEKVLKIIKDYFPKMESKEVIFSKQ